jgi:hypothetical protein
VSIVLLLKQNDALKVVHLYCDVTANSRKCGARARRPLLSNDSEIMFPLQRIAENESLSGKKLLNKRFPWQPQGTEDN